MMDAATPYDEIADHELVDPSGGSGAPPDSRPEPHGRRPLPEVMVLDVDGAPTPPAMPVILYERAAVSERSERRLKRFPNRELRQAFRGGRLSEIAFRPRLLECAGIPDANPAEWRDRLPTILTPRGSMARVCEWARAIRTVLLSDHRHPWLLPQLVRPGVSHCVTVIFISTHAGLVTPAHHALEPLLRLGAPADRVLFVDDRPDNISTAVDMGVQTVFAGKKETWMIEVDRRVGILEHAA